MIVTSGFLTALECTKFVFGRGFARTTLGELTLDNLFFKILIPEKVLLKTICLITAAKRLISRYCASYSTSSALNLRAYCYETFAC